MNKTAILAIVCIMAAANFASADALRGDIYMDFVTIGNAGNAADTTGYGAVDHAYRIGKYEVTAAQWQTINTAAGIGYLGSGSGDQPAAGISWYDAAQFCNYLTSGDKYLGAYNFDPIGDHDFWGIDRASSVSTYGTTYVIPTEDEWYKAAYYTGSGYSLYANGTGVAPVAGEGSNYAEAISSAWNVGTGTMEQNGTFDMMGNVWEWNETFFNGTPLGLRGGSWDYADVSCLASSFQADFDVDVEYYSFGFRVASIVPEPASALLMLLGAAWMRAKRKR